MEKIKLNKDMTIFECNFKKGQEVARKIGYPGEPVYRQMIESAIGAPAAA